MAGPFGAGHLLFRTRLLLLTYVPDTGIFNHPFEPSRYA